MNEKLHLKNYSIFCAYMIIDVVKYFQTAFVRFCNLLVYKKHKIRKHNVETFLDTEINSNVVEFNIFVKDRYYYSDLLVSFYLRFIYYFEP